MALPPSPLPTLDLNFTLNLNCKETHMMLQLTNANRAADDPPELRRLLVAPEHIVCVEPMTRGRTRIRTTAPLASNTLGHLLVAESYDDVLALMLRWQEGRR